MRVAWLSRENTLVKNQGIKRLPKINKYFNLLQSMHRLLQSEQHVFSAVAGVPRPRMVHRKEVRREWGHCYGDASPDVYLPRPPAWPNTFATLHAPYSWHCARCRKATTVNESALDDCCSNYSATDSLNGISVQPPLCQSQRALAMPWPEAQQEHDSPNSCRIRSCRAFDTTTLPCSSRTLEDT